MIDPNSHNLCFVTDGQLPFRQCLHPEACAKEIHLPAYYWKFSDLKKEYIRLKGGDLSRALIPISDVTKLQNMPAIVPTVSSSISDMFNGKIFSMFYIEMLNFRLLEIPSLIYIWWPWLFYNLTPAFLHFLIYGFLSVLLGNRRQKFFVDWRKLNLPVSWLPTWSSRV